MENRHKKWHPEELKWALSPEVELSATKSSGPGGQNVNKTESAVLLKWNLEASLLFDEETKLRLRHKLQARLTKTGDLVIKSQIHRDQASNKKEALGLLVEVLLQALFVPKTRKKTKPKKSSIYDRLRQKNKRSEVKKGRTQKWEDE